MFKDFSSMFIDFFLRTGIVDRPVNFNNKLCFFTEEIHDEAFNYLLTADFYTELLSTQFLP